MIQLHVTAGDASIILPLHCVPEFISRPHWVEEMIPHLDDADAETLADFLGDWYRWGKAWDTIAYQYTDGDATTGEAGDGRTRWKWTITLHGKETTRAKLRAYLNPER